MGWAELNALESNLTSLNNSLSSYNTKLSTQNKRKTKLEALIKEMKKVCNDDSDEVTDQIKESSITLLAPLKALLLHLILNLMQNRTKKKIFQKTAT